MQTTNIAQPLTEHDSSRLTPISILTADPIEATRSQNILKSTPRSSLNVMKLRLFSLAQGQRSQQHPPFDPSSPWRPSSHRDLLSLSTKRKTVWHWYPLRNNKGLVQPHLKENITYCILQCFPSSNQMYMGKLLDDPKSDSRLTQIKVLKPPSMDDQQVILYKGVQHEHLN